MTRNKNKRPQSSPNQERNTDQTEGPGRGGRGRGRGGRGGRGGANDGGGDDSPLRRGGIRGGGPSGSNSRGGAPPWVLDRGFGRGRGRGRGGWMGRGRGFGGADLGGFTGNFRGGRPAYHSMDEIDFEIQQWSELTRSLITRTRFPYIYHDSISQTNRHRVGGTPPAVAVGDHPQYSMGITHLEDVEVAVVVEATPRNFRLLRHCRVSGMKNGHYYGPSNLLGLSRLPHFFKRPRKSSSLPLKTRVRVPCS